MSKLPLAIDIADAVNEAEATGRPISVGAKADELRKAHPEADATSEDVADTIEEIAGISKKPDS